MKQKPLKIAFIGQKGIPVEQGGIEKHVQELSVGLADRGFDVTVYSRYHYTKSHQKQYLGVKIINLPSIKSKHLDAITHTLTASIHSLFQNYDIIHYHGVGPSLLSWIPRIFKPSAKVLATLHCLDREHPKWGLIAKLALTIGEWTACHFPHETIVVSKTLKKYCQKYYKHQTIYIPNGANVGSTTKRQNSSSLKQFDLKPNKYFLSVSRLVPQKQLHTLIEAYKEINTDKKLVIVVVLILYFFHNGLLLNL